MGGYVHFASRGVQTDEAIFGHVEELRLNEVPARVVKAGSSLDQALRKSIGCVGGDPIIVSSCKNEKEFTVEYKTGYGSTSKAAPVVSDDDDEDEPEPDEDDDE